VWRRGRVILLRGKKKGRGLLRKGAKNRAGTAKEKKNKSDHSTTLEKCGNNNIGRPGRKGGKNIEKKAGRWKKWEGISVL